MAGRVTTWLVGLACVGALLVPAQAGAHDNSFKSRVTIHHPSDPQYRGRVFSRSPQCVADRLVKLFTASGVLVGEDTTDDEGRWSYTFLGERYYAKVTRAVRGGAGHRHVCQPDRSPTI